MTAVEGRTNALLGANAETLKMDVTRITSFIVISVIVMYCVILVNGLMLMDLFCSWHSVFSFQGFRCRDRCFLALFSFYHFLDE